MEYIPINTARHQLRGKGGNPPSLATVYRWIREGCQPRPHMPAVRLEAVLLAGTLCTRPDWLEEFETARDEQHRPGGRPRPAIVKTSRGQVGHEKRAATYLEKKKS